jgi:hypothetical protein
LLHNSAIDWVHQRPGFQHVRYSPPLTSDVAGDREIAHAPLSSNDGPLATQQQFKMFVHYGWRSARAPALREAGIALSSSVHHAETNGDATLVGAATSATTWRSSFPRRLMSSVCTTAARETVREAIERLGDLIVLVRSRHVGFLSDPSILA